MASHYREPQCAEPPPAGKPEARWWRRLVAVWRYHRVLLACMSERHVWKLAPERWARVPSLATPFRCVRCGATGYITPGSPGRMNRCF